MDSQQGTPPRQLCRPTLLGQSSRMVAKFTEDKASTVACCEAADRAAALPQHVLRFHSNQDNTKGCTCSGRAAAGSASSGWSESSRCHKSGEQARGPKPQRDPPAQAGLLRALHLLPCWEAAAAERL